MTGSGSITLRRNMCASKIASSAWDFVVWKVRAFYGFDNGTGINGDTGGSAPKNAGYVDNDYRPFGEGEGTRFNDVREDRDHLVEKYKLMTAEDGISPVGASFIALGIGIVLIFVWKMGKLIKRLFTPSLKKKTETSQAGAVEQISVDEFFAEIENALRTGDAVQAIRQIEAIIEQRYPSYIANVASGLVNILNIGVKYQNAEWVREQFRQVINTVKGSNNGELLRA